MLPAPIKDTESSFVLPDQTCQRFTLAEIQSATNNFDETLLIGRGGFGKVYKCPITMIGSAKEVAIKRLHAMSNQGVDEFKAEVKVLSKLRHGNLVSLIGYCNKGKEMVLVYEFMPNGTLKDHLSKPDSSLSWLQRLKICIGAAQGLHHLHTGTSTQHGVIHRDVKTSNILLDTNFAAKISDFGLAKVGLIDQSQTHMSTAVKGTFGYMDPCYFYTGKLTRKSDVYAFGVVLFEVLSGREAVDPTLDEEQWGLAPWAQSQIKKGKLNQIVDPRLMGQISKKCLKEFANIADHCLRTQPKHRPTMAEVVVKLQSILTKEREKSILTQERESPNSVVDEEGLFYKLRSIFTGKVGVAQGSKYDFSSHTVDTAIESNTIQSFKTFTYDELVRATKRFKKKVYSPTVCELIYKGWVDERTYAPTKYGVGLPMYVRKIKFLTRKSDIKLAAFNHPNLTKLLGYCLKFPKLYCVYERIPVKSLDKYLYGEPGTPSLSWAVRLNVAIGAAQGLSYLHKKNRPAYSQFKTNLILVDTDFKARLSDFAFDSYTFRMDEYYAAPEWLRYQADTFNSISPQPFESGRSYYKAYTFDGIISQPSENGFSVKSEFYTFGVILLEILTGMEVHDRNRPLGKENLVKWAIPLLPDEVNLGMIMDPKLQHNDCPPKGAFKFAQIVSNCLQPEQDKRPSMEEIVKILNHCYQEASIETV